MKRISKVIIMLLILVGSLIFNQSESVKAANVIAINSYEDFSNQIVWQMQILDNGTVELYFKYGLRKVDVFYCKKGEQCDNGFYKEQNIMQSSNEYPYKNTSLELAKYDFKIQFEETAEYRVRVEAYFGSSSAYSGTEATNGGAFTITQKQILDTKDKYVDGSSNGVSDKRMSNLMDDLQVLTNTIFLPLIYVITTTFLIIKGTILGVQIVKGADDSSLRAEKVRALKWLVIGVFITYAGASLVGLVTGFFKTAFPL